MNIKSWVCICIVIICMIFMLFNRKIRCTELIKNSLSVFKDNRNGKIYWYDIFSFLISPVFISVAVVIGFDYYFNREMANTLLNVFSIMFTLLFGITSILNSATENKDEIKEKISIEAFTIASFSMLISLLSLVIVIIYIALLDYKFANALYMSLTVIVITLSIILVMLFLLVIKRSYITSSK